MGEDTWLVEVVMLERDRWLIGWVVGMDGCWRDELFSRVRMIQCLCFLKWLFSRVGK